jgi:pyruvate dehydrogenase E1 component beta subunit
MRLSEAVDDAIAQSMANDDTILMFGEDVRMIHAPLFARFGPDRIIDAPISESAFVGAAVGAAMSGLRPIVEVMLVDFLPVAMSAVIQEMAKVEAFSGGRWKVPLVLKAACGGGYGDGGQHEQNFWGLLAGIPGLRVVVPATPRDARGLMAAAIADPGPVVFLEHKLLSETWLEFMGRFGRETIQFDVPAAGTQGPVPVGLEPTPIGRAHVLRQGGDVTIVSLAVGVHRALQAAEALSEQGVSATVIDLRTVQPLDVETVVASVEKTHKLVVVDEDYEQFGLTGELAARLLERDLKFRYRRVAVQDTLPFARALEDEALPNVGRIIEAVRQLA